MFVAWPMERRFARHATVFACIRARLNAGSRMPIRTAMMPITTSSSTSVNALLSVREEDATKLRPRFMTFLLRSESFSLLVHPKTFPRATDSGAEINDLRLVELACSGHTTPRSPATQCKRRTDADHRQGSRLRHYDVQRRIIVEH